MEENSGWFAPRNRCVQRGVASYQYDRVRGHTSKLVDDLIEPVMWHPLIIIAKPVNYNFCACNSSPCCCWLALYNTIAFKRSHLFLWITFRSCISYFLCRMHIPKWYVFVFCGGFAHKSSALPFWLRIQRVVHAFLSIWKRINSSSLFRFLCSF